MSVPAEAVARDAPVAGRVQRECACAHKPARPCAECAAEKQRRVQPKLRLGTPGDRWEQEADRIAEQVVADRPTPISGPLPVTPLVQMQEDEDEERLTPEAEDEEELQAKAAAGSAPSAGRRAGGSRGRGRRAAAIAVRAGVVRAAARARPVAGPHPRRRRGRRRRPRHQRPRLRAAQPHRLRPRQPTTPARPKAAG